MLNISIKTIPHKKHRYETVGDYFDKDGKTHILVSDMNNEDYELLVAIHEILEQHLCKKRGIKEKDITKFDIAFEKRRAAGKEPEDAEPGDHPNAPYRKEHFFATNIERTVALELGVNWAAYDDKVMSL